MKNERRAKIIELIGQYPIETQEELAERLEKSGFPVTQATISRDIRELKLTKVSVDGVHQKYTLLQEKETNLAHKYIRVLQDGYLSMDQAENLLVIKTISFSKTFFIFVCSLFCFLIKSTYQIALHLTGKTGT